MAKKYCIPKPGLENERTVGKAQKDFVDKRPEPMPVGMVQVLITLKLLSTKGLVDPWLLSSECISSITGENSYGEVVIGNICHALATPLDQRIFKSMDFVLHPCICHQSDCICGVQGKLNAIPYLNLDLQPLLSDMEIEG